MIPGIEDIYALSPTQQGMLLASQAAPELYAEKFTCILDGKVDTKRLQSGWERTTARHPALRTSFRWKGISTPVQLVHLAARVVWREIDATGSNRDMPWTGYSSSAFDLSRPPLCECTLVKLDRERYRLVWDYHHLILDGWSVFVLLNTLMCEYASVPEAPAPAYRSFIGWLQGQNLDAAKTFWTQSLAGLEPWQPFRLRGRRARRESEVRYDLTAQQARAVHETARRNRVPAGTVYQAAWALVLARWSASQEIVYGLTVSGRPGELPESSRIAGMFVNTVPVRVSVLFSELTELLSRIQQHSAEAQRWGHFPTSAIQQGSGLSPSTPMFDTAFVYQNYPLIDEPLGADVKVSQFDGWGGRTHYAFTLLIAPGEPVEIRLIPGLGCGVATSEVLADFQRALDFVTGGTTFDWISTPASCPIRAEEETRIPDEPVAHIWSQVVGSFAPDLDLLESGGDSLSAVRLSAELNRKLGFQISPYELLRDRVTPDKLSSLLKERPLQLPARTIRRASPGDAPLSYAQRTLWALAQKEPSSLAYTGSIAIRISGPLRSDALDRALRSLVDRQECLRTVFVEVGGEPRQKVVPNTFALEYADFQSPADQAALAFRRAFTARPFSMESEPCFRAALMRFGPDRNELLVTVHHIVCDGWSVNVFMRDLSALYENQSNLPELPIQYCDYATWQANLDPTIWEQDLGYWKSKLISPPRLFLNRSEGSTARLDVVLAAETYGIVQQLCHSRGITPFVCLLAAYQAALASVFHMYDILTGTPLAERELPECTGLIGLMLNTIQMRTDLAGDPTSEEIMTRVSRTVDQAHRHSALPFGRLVIERSALSKGFTAPLDFWFVLDNTPRAELHLDGLECEVTEIPSHQARFPLALLLRSWEVRFSGYLEYDPALVSDQVANAIIDRIERFLDLAAHQPGGRLSELRKSLDPSMEFCL